MFRSSNASVRVAVACVVVVVVSLSTACTNNQHTQNVVGAGSAAPATFSVPSTTTSSRAGLYSIPVVPSEQGQGSFVRFETGWQRTVHLLSGVQTTCTRRVTGDSSTYSAVSSDFDRFDSGSDTPGEDFSVELVTYSYPEPTGASDAAASLTLSYVSADGVHHQLRAQDRLTVSVADSAMPGAGFSAIADVTDPVGTPYTVAVTGFVHCALVQQS